MVDMSTMTAREHLISVNTSSVERGPVLPRIAYFAELEPRKRDVATTPQRFPVLTQSPSRAMVVWCLDNRAEWHVAADCLALRISPNWDLENAMSPRHLKDSLF